MTRVTPDLDFLGEVALEHGITVARLLEEAIACGLLVDCGPAQIPAGATQITPWLYVRSVQPAVEHVQLKLGDEAA